MTTDSCMQILQISSLWRFLENDTARPERGLLTGNTSAATAMQKRAPITAARRNIMQNSDITKIATNRALLICRFHNEGVRREERQHPRTFGACCRGLIAAALCSLDEIISTDLTHPSSRRSLRTLRALSDCTKECNAPLSHTTGGPR